MSRHAFFPYLVLLIGVLITSSSSILIRYAQQQDMDSMAIATWRLGFAVLILSPVAWARAGDELRRLRQRDVLLGIGAGIFLALHFASWISSLEYTSVANSAALVTTNPVWVGLASWLFLRERLRWGTIGGVALTLFGSLCLVLSGIGDAGNEYYSNPMLGNMLALLGALTVSGYFLIGRTLRRRLNILAYIWLVYTSGAVLLLLWMLANMQPLLGYSLAAYLFVLALALGPQLLGHTSFNWALGHVSATLVAIAILGEPVSAALWAWFLFNESIDPRTWSGGVQLAGFALLIVGIYVAAVSERPTKRDVEVSVPASEMVVPVGQQPSDETQ
jgi:drug/metabolite transporter (DMT)-like permease